MQNYERAQDPTRKQQKNIGDHGDTTEEGNMSSSGEDASSTESIHLGGDDRRGMDINSGQLLIME